MLRVAWGDAVDITSNFKNKNLNIPNGTSLDMMESSVVLMVGPMVSWCVLTE